jgi:hypothetical protein
MSIETVPVLIPEAVEAVIVRRISGILYHTPGNGLGIRGIKSLDEALDVVEETLTVTLRETIVALEAERELRRALERERDTVRAFFGTR